MGVDPTKKEIFLKINLVFDFLLKMIYNIRIIQPWEV